MRERFQALLCLAERRAGFGHDRSRQQWTEHRIHASSAFTVASDLKKSDLNRRQ